MAWDHVDNAAGCHIPDLPPRGSVDVICPTWFHLDPAGVTSRARSAYVERARRRGLAIWGLVGNRFDPRLTQGALGSRPARAELVERLLQLALEHGLDGINIDFERVYPADAGRLTSLVELLSGRARRHGLQVSVDVTPPDAGVLAACYDLPGLDAAADYVALMAYDQHPASVPGPGPVAALDWTRRVLELTLQQVSADRLLLGVPLYCRLWTRQAGGTSSRDLPAAAARQLVRDVGASPIREADTGLERAAWTRGSDRLELWLEDPGVVGLRAGLAAEYGLAGVAAWQLRLAQPGTWRRIAAGLGRR